MYRKFFKRFLDFVLSFLALVLLSPVFLIVAILVRVKLGSPVIFKQKRPGKNEKIFTLYKFRTMTDERDENGELLPNDKRMTQFGRVLRKTSIDELPELFNIFKGDMSFIGPRPLRVEYLELYSEEQKHRHDVRPGLTGWAQINGRNKISWKQKFEYDVYYVNHLSLWLDIKVFFLTIKKVIAKSDIYGDESSEFTEKFNGEN